MNDPWDVKSVRQSDQYISCMKLNGVPLLPPLLSKECLEEMRNYKFLALEVEKRLDTLKSLTLQSDVNSSEDETDAPELPESDQTFDIPSVIESNSYKNKSPNLNPNIENGYEDYKLNTSNDNNSPTLSNVSECFSSKASSKLVIDLSLSINDTARNLIDSNNTSQTPNDLPERDCDCVNDNKNVGSDETKKQSNAQEKVTVSVSINKQAFSDPLPNFHLEDGPASLGSKSFTGSLTDLHKESTKEVKTAPLLRQRSYTVLKPSPMLLAHLEVQSFNRGVDVKSISMSESLSNVSCMNKKRRSWDLESAKIKWSSMALELKEKVKEKHLKHNSASSNITSKTTPKKAQSNTPSKLKPMDKSKRVTPKASVRSEPAQWPTKLPSPVRCSSQNPKPSPPQNDIQKKTEETKHKPISESEDPATKVRELYEKVQKQQLVQMANLVEKQKREQMLLHQLFEEQNNLLFTQLKTICPKSPNEVKEAWVEKDADRGPVSLSQLINQKTEPDSPVIATLTETNNYLNQCDQILKKSRNMSESIKRPPQEKPSTLSLEGSITRTHSPNTPNPNISRKLVYDTSASSERDYDVILTDRTNDTLADLNVTFPSDHSEESRPNSTLTNTCMKQTIESPLSAPVANASHRSSERAVKSMEETLQDSLRCIYGPRTKQKVRRNPTPQEREAATKIVACAKGYLVRRLMRTERVQTTVQTIRDTLVLALQLHQDGRGIWGADVDLHRRLIQQITAACYTLHDTFVASTAAERCALIAADRSRRKALAARPLAPITAACYTLHDTFVASTAAERCALIAADRSRRKALAARPLAPVRQYRPTDVMSASHSGAFPARPQRSSPALMTQSSYESYSGEKARRYVPSPRRRPWR